MIHKAPFFKGLSPFSEGMVVFNRYGMSMLQGAGVSLKIALVGTLVGCLIGFAVGIVQTIPSEKGDNHLLSSWTEHCQ